MKTKHIHPSAKSLALGLVAAAALAAGNSAHAALTVTPSTSANDLIAALLGPGVTVIGTPTLTSAANQSGTFSGGSSIGFGINSGVVLTTGNATLLPGANTVDGSGSEQTGNNVNSSRDFDTILGTPGNSDLNAIVGSSLATYDAAVLEFQFQLGDGTKSGSISMNYIFGSDEYIDFIGAVFNDAFGFFLDGANIALLPSTTIPVSIATVNPTTNSSFYINNVPNTQGYTVAGIPMKLDGFTTVLQATADLGPGVHTMKLAIADVGDPIFEDFEPGSGAGFDSAVFLQGGSFIQIPEPSTFALLGLAGLGLLRRRR